MFFTLPRVAFSPYKLHIVQVDTPIGDGQLTRAVRSALFQDLIQVSFYPALDTEQFCISIVGYFIEIADDLYDFFGETFGNIL